MKNKFYRSFSKKMIFKIFLLFGSMLGLLYLFMIIPVFFLYPNQGKHIEANIEKQFFDGIISGQKADKYTLADIFQQKCPLPTREVILNDEHVIVEIQMHKKWFAYDPYYKIWFENNAIRTAFDIRRGYVPSYLKNYQFVNSFKELRYNENHLYFKNLEIICPFYDDIMMLYYSVGS